MSATCLSTDVTDRVEIIPPENSRPLLDPWAPYMGILIGRVFNHPRLSDGKVIFTSSVLHVAEDQSYAMTRNTHYRLRNRKTVDDLLELRRNLRE